LRIVAGYVFYPSTSTLPSFASEGSVRRDWLESWPTSTGTALLMVCLSLGWCREVRVWYAPFTLVGGMSLCLEVSLHIEKVVGEGPKRRTREGGSEWEPIKILLEGDRDSNKMNTTSNTRL
jgi:hypothetical protein